MLTKMKKINKYILFSKKSDFYHLLDCRRFADWCVTVQLLRTADVDLGELTNRIEQGTR